MGGLAGQVGKNFHPLNVLMIELRNSPMLKPITLKPATYLVLAIGILLIILCLTGSIWFATY